MFLLGLKMGAKKMKYLDSRQHAKGAQNTSLSSVVTPLSTQVGAFLVEKGTENLLGEIIVSACIFWGITIK